MAEHEILTDTDEVAFYAELGRAVTDWALVEQELFAITHSILNCTAERAAIVFYRTPTIDSRITLTDDLISSFFPRHNPGEHPDTKLKLWNNLQRKMKEILPFRNKLAHHPVIHMFNVENVGDGKISVTHTKRVSRISRTEKLRKRKESDHLPVGIQDVRTHRSALARLIRDLRDFRLAEFSMPPTKRDE
jgi:hypothetical protein